MALRRNLPPRMNRGRNFTIAPAAITNRIMAAEGERSVLGPRIFPEKRLKQDALRLSFVEKKEITKAHCTHHLAAIDGAQTLAGLESALTAWEAAHCDRPLRQELPRGDENRFAEEVGAAKNRELDARCKFKVFSPVPWRNVAEGIVDTRWVLTWKLVEGRRAVKARLVARGYQDPDLAAGLADTASCVSLRSSPHQVISLGALKKWELWSLDIKNAFLQADPSPREVYLHAPLEWRPENPNIVWKLNAPGNGLNEAPVEFRRTLKRYLLQSANSPKLAGLRFEVSTLDPCLYVVYNTVKEAAGVFSSHIDDILGCGAPGVLDRTRYYLEQRFGPLKIQENSFAHVGMELAQKADFSVGLTQAEFARQLEFIDTSPELRKRRRRPLWDEEKLLRQCKMGELCWLATV